MLNYDYVIFCNSVVYLNDLNDTKMVAFSYIKTDNELNKIENKTIYVKNSLKDVPKYVLNKITLKEKLNIGNGISDKEFVEILKNLFKNKVLIVSSNEFMYNLYSYLREETFNKIFKTDNYFDVERLKFKVDSKENDFLKERAKVLKLTEKFSSILDVRNNYFLDYLIDYVNEGLKVEDVVFESLENMFRYSLNKNDYGNEIVSLLKLMNKIDKHYYVLEIVKQIYNSSQSFMVKINSYDKNGKLHKKFNESISLDSCNFLFKSEEVFESPNNLAIEIFVKKFNNFYDGESLCVINEHINFDYFEFFEKLNLNIKQKNVFFLKRNISNLFCSLSSESYEYLKEKLNNINENYNIFISNWSSDVNDIEKSNSFFIEFKKEIINTIILSLQKNKYKSFINTCYDFGKEFNFNEILSFKEVLHKIKWFLILKTDYYFFDFFKENFLNDVKHYYNMFEDGNLFLNDKCEISLNNELAKNSSEGRTALILLCVRFAVLKFLENEGFVVPLIIDDTYLKIDEAYVEKLFNVINNKFSNYCLYFENEKLVDKFSSLLKTENKFLKL